MFIDWIILWLGLSITMCYVFGSSFSGLHVTNGGVLFGWCSIGVLRWNTGGKIVNAPRGYSGFCVILHNFYNKKVKPKYWKTRTPIIKQN